MRMTPSPFRPSLSNNGSVFRLISTQKILTEICMCVVSSTVTMSDYVQRGITDQLLAKHLEALWKTVADDQQCDFWHAVRMFSDLNNFYQKLTLLSWAAYFPPLENDCTSVAARVFCVISGLVKM